MGYSLPNQRAATRSLRDHRKSIAVFWLQWILIKLSIYLAISYLKQIYRITFENFIWNYHDKYLQAANIFAPAFDAIDFHEMRQFLASKLRTVFNYTMHWKSIFGE